MGANLKLGTLSDLQRHGFHLRITCTGCGRSGVYGIRGVREWFQAKKLNQSLDAASTYFRCDECQHKGARLDPVAPYKVPDLPKLVPSRYELRERQRRERG